MLVSGFNKANVLSIFRYLLREEIITEPTPREIAKLMIVFREGLQRSLAVLAERQGLDWLSQFEDDLILYAKGVDRVVIMGDEVAAIKSSIEQLKLMFESARQIIAE